MNKVVRDVWMAHTVDKARDIIRDCITASKINNENKQKMLDEIEKITQLCEMYKYVTNAILAYEGNRVI